MVSEQYPHVLTAGNSESQIVIEENSSESQICDNMETSHSPRCQEDLEKCNVSAENASMADEDAEEKGQRHETRVWLRCDVYDTGIGIPGSLKFLHSYFN